MDPLFHQITLILENPQPTFGEKIAGIEKTLLLDALEKKDWVKIHAARHLKTTDRIFNYKCAQYGLERLRRSRKKKTAWVVLLDDDES